MTTTMRSAVRGAVVAGVMWMGLCGGAQGQGSNRNPSPATFPAGPGSDPLADPRVPAVSSATQEKMAISRNDERQRKLVADTNQLLDLATKLKEEVDKTDKYTLSLDVVKRTAEIEKLAKSIRERMKD